ncbi:MAG: Uma2 family endonuclease [Polyangiaceae bacterium]|nr:Uma2 family endonuclease [Polyangiaceae bacterium]
MSAPAETPPMTAEAYLGLERASPTRHEFVRGAIFAMSGATKLHNDVVANVAAVLKAHLRGRPCRTYLLDVKLHVEAADAYFYADVFVTCDPRDRDDPLIAHYPSLIVEVLSDSTAAYDRGEKFDDYRRLPELREYALVDSRQRHVVVYRSTARSTWEFDPVGADGLVRLTSVGLTVPMSAFYEDTDVPATRPRSEAAT